MGYDFLNSSHAGPGLVGIIKNSDNNETIIGRATGISWNDVYEVYPVDEVGKNGVDEVVRGRMAMSNGTINTFFAANILDGLPTRDSFISSGDHIMQIVVADGFPNAGTLMGQFEGVEFPGVSGQFNATGLASVNVNFVYTKRLSGKEAKDQLGVTYPVE